MNILIRNEKNEYVVTLNLLFPPPEINDVYIKLQLLYLSDMHEFAYPRFVLEGWMDLFEKMMQHTEDKDLHKIWNGLKSKMINIITAAIRQY